MWRKQGAGQIQDEGPWGEGGQRCVCSWSWQAVRGLKKGMAVRVRKCEIAGRKRSGVAVSCWAATE